MTDILKALEIVRSHTDSIQSELWEGLARCEDAMENGDSTRTTLAKHQLSEALFDQFSEINRAIAKFHKDFDIIENGE